jgi:hypothetical protein
MLWFEDNEQYKLDLPSPAQFGFEHLSLVKVYPNGKTQPGWGAKDFVANMEKGLFEPRKAIRFYEKYQQPFAFVMRSVPLICVDIDGKNGGMQIANALGLNQPTLAERSRSLNGYHLFYRMPYTSWTAGRGYDEFDDIIGLLPGIDIKGTGLVFHYPNQRWNEEDIQLLPPSLAELIGRARDVRRAARITKLGTQDLDEDELVIVHDQLRDELNKKVDIGNRNNRLYAIGAQMFVTQYPSWDLALYDRGVELGLTLEEVTELIKNIEQYA